MTNRISVLFLLLLPSLTYGFQSSVCQSLVKNNDVIKDQSIITKTKTKAKTTTTTTTTTATSLHGLYGRGAEIWPESNDDTVQLSDSFPNGEIPYSAVIAIEKTDMESLHQRVEASIIYEDDDIEEEEELVAEETSSSSSSSSSTTGVIDPAHQKTKSNQKASRRRRTRGSNNTRDQSKRKRQYLKRILRRAAAKEELDTEGEYTSIDKTPMVVAMSLVVKGLVRPMDVCVVACWTAYFIVLNMAAQSSRDWTGAPILPATPPQGHVPTLLSNPLGLRTEQSRWYNAWLQLGVVIGLIGPLALVVRCTMIGNLDVAKFCARPLFLLCCQIVTEAVSKRSLVRLQ
jgi:hypothetical protein